MYSVPKIIIVPDIVETVQRFIREHFYLILPFEVSDGYDFQIRLTKEQHAALTEKELNGLKSWVKFTRYDDLTMIEKEEDKIEYLTNHYWKNTDSYQYDFHAERAIVLNMRCKYGCEGLETCVAYVFVEDTEFEPFILANMDKHEGLEWVRGKGTRVVWLSKEVY